MQIGEYKVETITTCRFGLDGGSMFGVVPKALWERRLPPDENNRIPMVTRVILLRRQNGSAVLIDTGMGAKWTQKERNMFAIEDLDLPAQLKNKGISKSDVTHVICTHLHFDHAGGLTTYKGKEHHIHGPKKTAATPKKTEEPKEPITEEVTPTFPNSVHLVSQKHWQWASAPTLKDRGSFRREDFLPIQKAGLLKTVDPGEKPMELLPNIFIEEVHGHTPGMMLIRIDDGNRGIVFGADLFPTRYHLKPNWNMAFDNEPILTLSEKTKILSQVFKNNRIIVLEHDPDIEAVRLTDESGAFREISLKS